MGIRVLKMNPGEKQPRWIYVDNTLEALQGEVGGYIETVPLEGTAAVMIVNEEGRNLGLSLTYHDLVYGWLVGPILLVGVDGEEFCDLPLRYGKIWSERIKLGMEQVLKGVER